MCLFQNLSAVLWNPPLPNVRSIGSQTRAALAGEEFASRHKTAGEQNSFAQTFSPKNVLNPKTANGPQQRRSDREALFPNDRAMKAWLDLSGGMEPVASSSVSPQI